MFGSFSDSFSSGHSGETVQLPSAMVDLNASIRPMDAPVTSMGVPEAAPPVVTTTGGIPKWVWIAGGLVIVGGIAFVALR